MDKEIVVESRVILDILVTSRPGHRMGKLIGVYLIDNDIRITIPMPVLFEIKSGLLKAKQEAGIQGRSLPLNEDISESTPLKYNFIPIDQAFFEKYFQADLSHIPASDHMYVALAKVNELPLISEDPNLSGIAKEAGVKVYSSEEYRNMCLASLQ